MTIQIRENPILTIQIILFSIFHHLQNFKYFLRCLKITLSYYISKFILIIFGKIFEILKNKVWFVDINRT